MDVIIRKIQENDCKVISDSFKKQGWDKPTSQYENYLSEQISGERTVLVAFINNDFVGHLTIKWESHYSPFKEKKIPEITDLNVLEKYQKKGIATKLMDASEKIVSKHSNVIGIRVGLTKDYGNAQALYVKRGYIPDKNGISQNEHFFEYGNTLKVDDDLVLCFVKELK
ncbi:GNAT family N-acetyltransferase [bacterium]|nr:GNAT family N-acetyltransferase [bacterium]